MPSKKGGETMYKLSKKGNGEQSFSRRFTLKEIWGYLDKKYPENSKQYQRVSMKKGV
jgi:hypothetical protein